MSRSLTGPSDAGFFFGGGGVKGKNKNVLFAVVQCANVSDFLLKLVNF